MSIFEKLETRIENGISKKGRKVMKNSRRVVSPPDESEAGNFKEEVEDEIFNHSGEFRTHRNGLYESWPKRESS